ISRSTPDFTVQLTNTETKECHHELKGHYKQVEKVAYSPAGDVIASCSDDCTVRLWDVATGDCRHIMIGHTKSVHLLKWSPSGDQLASCSNDGSIRLWDTVTGTSSRTMAGHIDRVYCVVYSPRGDVLVSSGRDKTMRLWDVTSGRCHVVIKDSQHAILDMDWKETVDGGYLVAGSEDGGVWVFKVVDDGDQYQFRLHWRTTKGELGVNKTTIQDVQGLSQLNKKLLKQRGAVGDPADHLRETSEKVLRMASAVSKLKTPSNGTAQDPPSKPSLSLEELCQRVKEENNLLLQELLSTIAKCPLIHITKALTLLGFIDEEP
ncbi:hypothetical protein BGX31_003007, partial [Mortierella sp. GBA43]